jgi:GNAT superfamily N-acetyltransferase
VPGEHRIREIDPTSEAEIALVTRRMRETLVHVLGEEQGTALYTMEWLRERLLWHMDPAKSTAQVFVAELANGHIAGHTIVRVDRDDDGREIGLFSTTFVEPESRRLGVATSLIRRGEEWLIAHDMPVFVTDTAVGNVKLIRLFEKHGYRIVKTVEEMVRLSKARARVDQ